MNPIIRYSALFLLLLFVRVMTPDALLLQLHHHAHTEHATHEDAHQAKVEKEHQHCPVEDLFEASFQGGQQPALAVPIAHHTVYISQPGCCLHQNHTDLEQKRGPPVV